MTARRRTARRRAAGLFLATATWWVLSGCGAGAPPPRSFGLVYGVSLYVDARPEGYSPNLRYCDDDARAMAATLLENGYAVVTTRTNAEATAEQLRQDLAGLAGQLMPQDLLLVYFSGHGGVLSDFGIPDAEVAQRGLPVDSEWIFTYGAIDPQLSSPYLSPEDIMLERALYDAQLAALLDTVPVSRRVLVIDACNSGGFIGGGVEVDTVPAAYRELEAFDPLGVLIRAVQAYAQYGSGGQPTGAVPSDTLVLSAAGAREFSYEDSTYGQGVFTYFFLAASRVGDLDRDGWVTAGEAYSYAVAAVQTEWNADPSIRDTPYVFHPHISGGPVDFVLFRTP